MSLPKDERETPPELFKRLDARFAFTLDACATARNALCPLFNTKGSMMRHTWTGARVFCNPPYSSIREWVATALAYRGGAEVSYLLLPNWTDRLWWQELIEPVRDRGLGVTTEFMPRARFLVDGQPIRNKKGQIGQPEFGLVGVIIK